jgi:hypothetical protein
VPDHPHDVPEGAAPEPQGRTPKGQLPEEPAVPEGSWPAEGLDDWDEASWEPLVRPAWWRWVAIVLVVALVVATPLAYGVYLIVR